MARPVTAALTDEVYDALLHLSDGDEENGWMALHLVAATTEQLAPLDDIARDDDQGRPGWWSVLDVDACPLFALPWLAQFIGAVCSDGLSAADLRMCIRDASGRRRGTPAAMRTAIGATLTGTRAVVLTERFGGAYRLKVQTYVSETPDQAATLAAILSQKPAGLVLTYEVLAGATWDQALGTWDAQTLTWDQYTTVVP